MIAEHGHGLEGVRLFGMRALVARVEIKNKAGLFIPDSARDSGETANVCRVVAIGDGKFIGRDGTWMQLPLRLKVGDLVVTDPRFAIPIRIDGTTYAVFEEEHIVIVLDREMEVM